ncbi:phage tail protein [Roseibium album]|uniref:phage tail protein n=1 Tax=Roseibium album TaxID=311410 RepID=UPI00391AA6A0
MTTPNFGMQVTRPDDEIQGALGADFSHALLIDVSEDASAASFPVDTPVRGSTSDTAFMADLGTGLLADAAKGMHDQLTSLNSGADVTVVRVAEGADAAATAAAIAAIIDGITEIPSAVNKTPRIVVAGSTAYRLDLDTVGPVITALQAALPKIMAVAPVDVDGTSMANAIDARETMSSERLMPIGVQARVYDADSNLITVPMAPRVAGLMARVDNEVGGGKPFHPFANRFLYGIAGLSRKIPFSLLDGSTEGQQMLAANVSIVAEGETGVDGAVADGGYKFIGTDNAQTSTLWEQIHQVRGTDYIITQMLEITKNYLGRRIHADTLEAWLNSLFFMLRDHVSEGNILGHSPKTNWFTASLNSPENIRLGHLTVNIGIEPAPVFKVASHEIRRWRPAIDAMVNELTQRLANDV